MKKNNRTALIIVGVVAAVILGVWAANSIYHSNNRKKECYFMVRDTASVTKVYMADRKNQETLLERQDQGWTLNGTYKAHPKQVEYLLTTLYKIRNKMPVSKASHDNIVKQLATQSTKVEVYQQVPRVNLFDKLKLFYHEDRTKVFYVGDATMDNSGTFMLREGSDQAYIVHIPGFRGYISTRFTANPDDWRDHTIFHETLANIQSVTIEFGGEPMRSFRIDNTGKHQYQLTRLGDDQVLPYDTLKVINLLASFNDIRFEALINNLVPEQRRDSVLNSQFLHRITLVNKQGKEVSMKTFKKRVQRILDIPEE